MILLSFLTRFFSSVQRDRDLPEDNFQGTILITKYQGLGSLLLASGAIARLKRSYPRATFIFVGTVSTLELAKKFEVFDEYFCLSDDNILSAFLSLLQILYKLKIRKIDWSFDLEVYSHLAGVISYFIHARNRVGFILETAALRQHIYTELIFFNRNDYLGRAYWRLLGVINPPKFHPEDPFDHASLQLKKGPSNPIFPEKYVVLNINASDLSLERRWPRQYFESWSRKFLEVRSDYSIVLVGSGGSEGQEVDAFFEHPRIRKLANQLSLDDFCRCIQGAQLVISNDSGPLHFAYTLGIPVIGLFGPTSAQAYLPPNSSKVISIQEPMYCSPCVHHWDRPPCKGNNQCLKSLPWEKVWNASLKPLGLSDSLQLDVPAPILEKSFYPGRFIK